MAEDGCWAAGPFSTLGEDLGPLGHRLPPGVLDTWLQSWGLARTSKCAHCTLRTAHRTAAFRSRGGLALGRTAWTGVRGEDRLGLTPARGAPIRVQIRSALDRPLQFPFVFLFAQPRRRHLLATRQTRRLGRLDQKAAKKGQPQGQGRSPCSHG
ncbi:uncharacterized protein K444DRAFT_636564 [Hyaloscypha bicolor E]|uniref:Uncharacterized protein n=1 Tax=Hyaloscypha bicolor E TaxID=1095630 RepID=A0A2J6SKF2_9HELO|nr:uncharacterized protein K444DRAFT_636564 [Hyaloscypha bicolor E]PMD51235.1 hypothetical protein K444DRAFT_636564 [Hyaloscypha bicolor E]